jgi:hypothetical protein
MPLRTWQVQIETAGSMIYLLLNTEIKRGKENVIAVS